jgi:hypothetical protein
MAKLIQEATEKIPEIRKNLRQEATYDETHTLRPIIAFVSNFAWIWSGQIQDLHETKVPLKAARTNRNINGDTTVLVSRLLALVGLRQTAMSVFWGVILS